MIDSKTQKEKEKRDKNKKFIIANIGNEPVYKGIPGQNEKIDLINGLNYYSKIQGVKESFEYLENFIANEYPELLSKLKIIRTEDVTNKGFVIRMISNGFHFSPSNEIVIERILDFIKEYQPRDIDSDIIPSSNKGVKKNSKEIEFFNSIDTIIDDHSKELNIQDIDTKGYKALETYLNDMLKDVESNSYIEYINPDNEKLYKESGYLKQTVSRLNQIYEWIQSAIVQTKKTIVRQQAVKVKKIDPYKMVKDLKYLKSNDLFKSIDPKDILGKKKLYIWDTKYRRLRCLISESDIGFQVRGTTILNVNVEKSSEKSIKEKDIPALASNKNISSLNNFYKNISPKTYPPTGTRVNEFQIILMAS